MSASKAGGPTPDFVYDFPQPTEFKEVQAMATTECSLLLASSSKFRRELFARAAIPHGAFSAPLDEDCVQDWLETKHPELSSGQRTVMIAQLKADAAVHALKGPNMQHLQQLRLQNQILNLPEAERLNILKAAERAARQTGRATAAVAHLASFTESCLALEAADGRQPVLITVDTGVELNGRVMFKPKDKKEAECFLKSYSNTDSPIIITTSVVLVDLMDELDSPPWNPNAAVPAKRGFPYKCRACGKPQQPKEEHTGSDSCSCPLEVVHAANILGEAGGPATYRFSSREVFTVQSEVRFNKMDADACRRIVEEGEVMCSAGAVLIERGEMAKYLKSIVGCPHSVIGFPLGHLNVALARLLKRLKSDSYC